MLYFSQAFNICFSNPPNNIYYDVNILIGLHKGVCILKLSQYSKTLFLSINLSSCKKTIISNGVFPGPAPNPRTVTSIIFAPLSIAASEFATAKYKLL